MAFRLLLITCRKMRNTAKFGDPRNTKLFQGSMIRELPKSSRFMPPPPRPCMGTSLLTTFLKSFKLSVSHTKRIKYSN